MTRDYQSRLVQDCVASLTAGRNTILQACTGLGKTWMGTAIAKELIGDRRGDHILWIAHRAELLHQAEATFGRLGLRPENRKVAMIGTALKQFGDRPPILIVIDEAHRACADTYVRVIDAARHGSIPVLGLTATPQRTDGRGLGESGFTDLHCGPPMGWAIAHGYLTPYRLLSLLEPDDNTIGDFARNWEQHAERRKTVCFFPSVEEAIANLDSYRALGATVEVLHGGLPAIERSRILRDFSKARDNTILLSCDLLIEGVDVPSISSVQFCRKTESLIIWLQGVGRGLRPAPGKSDLIILDHAANYARLGLPDSQRRWSLSGTGVNEPPAEEGDHLLIPRIEEAEQLKLGREYSSGTLTLIGLDTDSQWDRAYKQAIARRERKGYKPAWLRYEIGRIATEIGVMPCDRIIEEVVAEMGWKASSTRFFKAELSDLLRNNSQMAV